MSDPARLIRLIADGGARADAAAVSIARAEEPIAERAEWRLLLVAAAFLIGFAAVALKMSATVMLTPFEPRVARAVERHPERAPILDRAGRPLALNLPAWSIYAHPREMDDPEAAAFLLAEALDLDPERMARKIAPGRTFAWVKRPVTPEERQRVHDLGLPGVYFGEREARVYPAGRVAAHILGGARDGEESVHSAELVGLAGVERWFDERLRDPARGGAPLRLSIDLAAQAALTDVLREAMERFDAVGAAGVLMEARTGKLAAMVSLPDFDPNQRPNPADPEVMKTRPLLNRAAGGVYELGSTFKPIFAALAMQQGVATPDTPLDAKGPLRWGRFAIRDFHRMDPVLTLTETMVESSNVATGRLAMMIGTPAAQAFLRELGFFDPPPVEIAEAGLGKPLLPPRWSELSTITISYGHGLAATPLHLAAAYATLTNGGLKVRPTLDATAAPPGEADRVVSERVSRDMRDILRAIVTRGTGKNAEVDGYEVGGKTGTADKPKPGGGYYDKKVIATFAAVFPVSDPEYVLVLSLDEPEDRSTSITRRTAGWTAAPTAGAAIARLAPLLGLRPKLPQPEPALPAPLAVAAVE